MGDLVKNFLFWGNEDIKILEELKYCNCCKKIKY